jgi:hypothetical protein
VTNPNNWLMSEPEPELDDVSVPEDDSVLNKLSPIMIAVGAQLPKEYSVSVVKVIPNTILFSDLRRFMGTPFFARSAREVKLVV